MKQPLLSFRIGILGNVSVHGLYSQLYNSITDVVAEDDVEGVQIFPAEWPRKVLISLTNETAKESLIINGLTLNKTNIELKDENEEIIKITVKDAPIQWSDDVIKELFLEYGKIIHFENEYVNIDGRRTKWKTGTRFIHMSEVHQVIPPRITKQVDGKDVSMTVWYKRPPNQVKCYKCGDQHESNKCGYANKVCFICKEDHQIKDCPKNNGSRSNHNVYCFMSERSPFSNFNMNFSIYIGAQSYNCNEQYIQSEKAKLFDDFESFKNIMS